MARDYPLPRRRYTGGTCESCYGPLEASQDPGDDFPEVWCPAARPCEAPGCEVRACGDDAPQPCAMCGFLFCATHLANLADEDVCTTCERGVREPPEPDMDDYTGPRGSEAADELAWRQDAARRLK